MIKDLTKISDCNYDDLINIIELGISFKNGKSSSSLIDKTAVLLFDKPSLRTKLSFMIGVQKLGGNAIYFSPEALVESKCKPPKIVLLGVPHIGGERLKLEDPAPD